MTRRIVAFTDKETGVTYKTPEFNGDRAEQIQFGLMVSCRSNWREIFAEFEGVSTLEEFKAASERAQRHWQPVSIFSPYVSIPASEELEVLPIEEYKCAGQSIISGSTGRAIELHY